MAGKFSSRDFDAGSSLLLAMLAAAGVRLYLLWQYYCITSDGVRYIAAAKDFFAGDFAMGLSSLYPPGYPLLIAAAFPLVGEWERAGQILSVVFGVLLLWPLYLLLRDVYDEQVAKVACILAALSPFLARYSAHVRSESAFLFLSTLALLLFYRGYQSRQTGRFFLGGLVAGFAYLVRPEALGFLIIVPAFLAYRWLRERDPRVLWIVQSSAVTAAAFMLFALPYIVYLSIDTGKWGAVSRKAGVTLGISLQESGLLDADASESSSNVESMEFVDLIRRHPLIYAQKVALDIAPAIWVYFEAVHFAYVPFLLAGLWFVFRSGFWERRDPLILWFAGFYLFAFALIYVKRRYSLQVVPVSLGWVAVGVLWARDSLTARFTGRLGVALFAFLMLVLLGGTLAKTLTPISREKSFVREAGWYLRERNQSGDMNIAVFDERVTFYAGAKTIPLWEIDESALPARLSEQKADYLAAEIKTWQRYFPDIASRPELYGLVLEREFVGTRKDRLLLFKVT